MKQYVCHKRVKAAQIAEVIQDGEMVTIVTDDDQKIVTPVGEGIIHRYQPVAGDYLVEYELDGYRSISPKAAFEEGYHEFTPETAS